MLKITVEEVRRKAEAPYTKGHSELQAFTITMPELFCKNALAPIFKTKDSPDAAEQNGESPTIEQGKKARGQQQQSIEMRYEDFAEAVSRSQNKNFPAGGLRSTLENQFMDEGIREPAAAAKQPGPQNARGTEFAPNGEPPFTPHMNMYPPHMVPPTNPQYMYMQDMQHQEDYEEVDYGAPPRYAGHGMYNPQYQPDYPPHAKNAPYMQPQPPYYYVPAPAAPGYAPAQAQPKPPGSSKNLKNSSEKDESLEAEVPEQPQGMQQANHLKNAGVIDDLEMGYQYGVAPDRFHSAHVPQGLHPYYDYDYMVPGRMDPGDEYAGMHMPQYHNYPQKGHDPYYHHHMQMVYNDPYQQYGMPPNNFYDFHGGQYIHQGYDGRHHPHGPGPEDDDGPEYHMDLRNQNQNYKKRAPLNSGRANDKEPYMNTGNKGKNNNAGKKPSTSRGNGQQQPTGHPQQQQPQPYPAANQAQKTPRNQKQPQGQNVNQQRPPQAGPQPKSQQGGFQNTNQSQVQNQPQGLPQNQPQNQPQPQPQNQPQGPAQNKPKKTQPQLTPGSNPQPGQQSPSQQPGSSQNISTQPHISSIAHQQTQQPISSAPAQKKTPPNQQGAQNKEQGMAGQQMNHPNQRHLTTNQNPNIQQQQAPPKGQNPGSHNQLPDQMGYQNQQNNQNQSNKKKRPNQYPVEQMGNMNEEFDFDDLEGAGSSNNPNSTKRTRQVFFVKK